MRQCICINDRNPNKVTTLNVGLIYDYELDIDYRSSSIISINQLFENYFIDITEHRDKQLKMIVDC